MKLKLLVFLTVSIVPNVLFAQYMQQGQKLIDTGASFKTGFGSSVAISADGSTAIVGASGDDGNLGGVWIFTRSGGVWTQQGQKLYGTGARGYTMQGSSVAISSDGNTAIVGGPGDYGAIGGIWVFTRNAGVWTQQGLELIGSDSAFYDYQGSSVALSSDGNTLIEGGFGNDSNAGAVWVFTRSGGVWTQQGSKLVGTGAVGSTVYQGNSVSLSSDGNTAIEGGYLDSNGIGAAWIFTRSGGIWTQQGSKLVGTGSIGNSVYQGYSVAISSDGNTAIEGGYVDNSHAGATWVFTRSGSVWTQQGPKLVGTGAVGIATQGHSLAISPDGNTAVVGAPYDNSSAGSIWVFARSNSQWTQMGSKLVGAGASINAAQGVSVGISSDGTIIEGASVDNNFAGAAWIFVNSAAGVTTNSSDAQQDINLSQNYPNPFNPSTVIKFYVPESGFVKLIVYDVFGKEVATIVNEHLDAGTHEVDFDGSKIAGGTYYYKLDTEGSVEMKKMILVK